MNLKFNNCLWAPLLAEVSVWKVGTGAGGKQTDFTNMTSRHLSNCWHKYLRGNGAHWPSSVKAWSTLRPEGERKLLSILKGWLCPLLKRNMLSFTGRNWLFLRCACWGGRPYQELRGSHPTLLAERVLATSSLICCPCVFMAFVSTECKHMRNVKIIHYPHSNLCLIRAPLCQYICPLIPVQVQSCPSLRPINVIVQINIFLFLLEGKPGSH